MGKRPSSPFLEFFVEHRRWRTLCCWEEHLEALGAGPVAGLDEVGRGCLAGPVVAAAVVLAPGAFIPGLDDSKVLRPDVRAGLIPLIVSQSLAQGVGAVSAAEIDATDILVASKEAMRRALVNLSIVPCVLLLDAVTLEGMDLLQIPIIEGDSHVASIAAASVVAKVYRDGLMDDYARLYPGYGFAENKGYGTEGHRAAIRELGPTPLHRLTFRMVNSK